MAPLDDDNAPVFELIEDAAETEYDPDLEDDDDGGDEE